ncbi:isoprenylcysteine carboxylmethyltransferase family protein [Methanobrevibacter sp.]|uniref:methyltransferase family protein n=1 Tax=Methanobrevibacter sp. TaxID=66852 RepID=UPI0026E09EF4|nr:methyltransferase [Methanobrevibacter sp.]MDO5823418.1 methyltransferase [Methanobrevibacter sp.]
MDENHLPVFGIGPYLISIIGIITIISSILSYYYLIPIYKINELNMVFLILGTILIIFGIAFWIPTVLISKIDKEVENNNLVTTGICDYLRHPIYALFFYIAVGLILISQNIFFVLPVIIWAFLTVVILKTEETWLIDKWGQDYLNYSKKVNGFISKVI